jgi:hypothetical protein
MGQEGGGQDDIVDVVGYVSGPPGQLHENERELADLGEPHAHQQGRRERTLEYPDHQGLHEQLADHHQTDDHPEERKVGDHAEWVDEGTDGDEEECHERIAQGEQSRERLVGVVRVADEQARQEGPQGQGESHGLRHRRRPQSDGERDQQKQLLIVGAGDPRHKR